MNPEDFMRLALSEAKKGDSPYGAVIVKDNMSLYAVGTAFRFIDVYGIIFKNLLRQERRNM